MALAFREVSIGNIDWSSIANKPATATRWATFAEITSKPTTLDGYGITDAAPSSHVGSTGNAHGVATSSANGFMGSGDRTKLDGIDDNANKYMHPTGDGNKHVPANGTNNDRKYLKATGTAGVYTWSAIVIDEITDLRDILADKASLDGADFTGAVTVGSQIELSAATGSVSARGFVSNEYTINGIKTETDLPLTGLVAGMMRVKDGRLYVVVEE